SGSRSLASAHCIFPILGLSQPAGGVGRTEGLAGALAAAVGAHTKGALRNPEPAADVPVAEAAQDHAPQLPALLGKRLEGPQGSQTARPPEDRVEGRGVAGGQDLGGFQADERPPPYAAQDVQAGVAADLPQVRLETGLPPELAGLQQAHDL